jgi:hypothetical protein
VARSKFVCHLEMSVRVFLIARGCSFENERFDVILNFLESAEIECPDDFVGLRSIIDIPGWEELRPHEVEVLQTLVDKLTDGQIELAAEKGCKMPRNNMHDVGCLEPGTKWQKLEQNLAGCRAGDLDIASKGPRAAGALLVNDIKRGLDRDVWLERARVAAIVGSCPKSHASVISGLRFWAFFAIRVLNLRGNLLPPTLEGLLAWSRLFRNKGTFCNYVSYVKLGCEVLGLSVDVFAHPSLARAKEAIKKRRLVMPRQQTWIGHDVLVRLLNLAADRPELNELAMIFLASYAFLLRVPSECLPMAAHEAPCNSEVPVFCIRGGEAVLRLPFRKNRLFPTEIVRSCWCKSCKSTCPVHVFGAFMRGLPAGARPFALFNPGQTLLALRELLCELGIEHAMLHRLHDFRRGHAEDLRRLPGTTLGDRLDAGDWSSGAFKDYLDRRNLEKDRVAAAHGRELQLHVPSDSDGDSD